MEVIRNVDNEFMITAHHQNDVIFFSHQHFHSLSLNRQHHSSFAHVMLFPQLVRRCMEDHISTVVLESCHLLEGIHRSGDQILKCPNPICQQCGNTCACGVFSCSFSQSNKKQEFKFSQSAWTPYYWSLWQLLKYNIHCDNETILLLVSHLIYTELK